MLASCGQEWGLASRVPVGRLAPRTQGPGAHTAQRLLEG